MATLKILWAAKQDMRRVQVVAVNQTLVALDNRAVANWNELRFRDLLDYVLLVFPEIDTETEEVLLYYTDDDEELVRITNDVELTEGFRLMKEIAVAMGRGENNAVCKITLVTRPLAHETATPAGNNPEELRSELVSQALEADQQKRMMALFVDLSKVVEKWEPSWEHEELKRDVVSLLHEPGCQEALLEIMSNQKVSYLMGIGGDFSSCLVNVAGADDLDEIAKILLMKCPQARLQIERVLQQLQHNHNLQRMTASDYFEAISSEDTKEDQGPIVAVFEGDVTCPDGIVLKPSEPFDKVWKIRNAGPTKWPSGTKLLCVGGDKMQAPESVLIPSVLPGSSIDVSLRMVTPATAGRYTGYWRLCTPNGTRFGQRLWVDINILAPGDAENVAAGTAPHRVAAPAPVVTQNVASRVQVPAPAAVVVPAPKKPTEEELRWAAELQSLADMGFTDKDRNILLLAQHNGDLNAVISSLL
ncbi:Phosphatidylinositol kinase, partial [Globisporangium splendens]